AAERDQLGLDLALELFQLGDATGRNELLEPALDPGADAAQLPRTTLANQSCDVQRGPTDELGRAPVGARRVRVGVAELEQRRERLQPERDRRVVHAVS